MISIAALVILSGSGIFAYGQVLRKNNYSVSQEIVIGAIRRAQMYSIAKKNGGVWGICRSGGDILIFRGTCNSPVVSERFKLDGGVSVTALSSTMFNARGEPDGQINANLSGNGISGNVSVNLAGGISY